MFYTLLTLPYTALPCVIVTVNNLQAPVKFTVHVLVFTVKSTGSLYRAADSRLLSKLVCMNKSLRKYLKENTLMIVWNEDNMSFPVKTNVKQIYDKSN